MQSILHLDPLSYEGPELRSHWIFNQFGVQGDAIAAFAGPCRVQIEDMVDLEDVHQDAPIYSEHMLHFLIEHFQTNLPAMILRQRLFAAQLRALLHQSGQPQVLRRGDDLMDQEAKLSVSIATVSPVSGLIHFGINISSENTPVLTRGLNDYGIDWQAFATQALQSYLAEEQGLYSALTKVRWVH